MSRTRRPAPSTGPRLAVDCIVADARGRVLVIRRRSAPFAGQLALPGGFVEAGESVEDACRRELREETGVEAKALTLVGVYSEPGRDPRGDIVSVTYATRVASARGVAGDDAAQILWLEDWRAAPLAFDHRRMLDDWARLRAKTAQGRAGRRIGRRERNTGA